MSALALLVARPIFPCEPPIDRWDPLSPFDVQMVVGGPAHHPLDGPAAIVDNFPLFFDASTVLGWENGEASIAATISRITDRGPVSIDVPIVRDEALSGLITQGDVYRPVAPLEDGDYRGPGTVIRVDHTHVDTPAPITNQVAVRLGERGGSSGLSCSDGPCGPTTEVSTVEINISGLEQGQLYGNYLLTVRDERTGEVRSVLASSSMSGPDGVRILGGSYEPDHRLCIALTGIGWSGARGDSVDLGCHDP